MVNSCCFSVFCILRVVVCFGRWHTKSVYSVHGFRFSASSGSPKDVVNPFWNQSWISFISIVRLRMVIRSFKAWSKLCSTFSRVTSTIGSPCEVLCVVHKNDKGVFCHWMKIYLFTLYWQNDWNIKIGRLRLFISTNLEHIWYDTECTQCLRLDISHNTDCADQQL